MRSSLVAILFSLPLLACGSSSSGDGGGVGDACDATTNPCNSDAVCDMTASGGAVCIEADGDVDNDGIANNLDFCQHLAGGKYDEDRDGIGDECDACPIAKSDGRDTDNDGVDSPCDPHPAEDGDKIAFFTGFNDGAFPAKFVASAAWKVVGGEAIMTPTNVLAREEAVISAGSTTGNIAIMSSYRFDSLGAGSNGADAGVFGLSNLPMSGKITADCGSGRAGDVDSVNLKTDAGSNSKVFANLFDPANAYGIVEQLQGVNVACAIAGPTTASRGAVTTMSNGNPPTQAGLFARGATIRFAYLLVVEK